MARIVLDNSDSRMKGKLRFMERVAVGKPMGNNVKNPGKIVKF